MYARLISFSDADPEKRENAIHFDILYSPLKRPDIDLSRVAISKDGKEIDLIRHYRPTEFVKALM